MYCQTLCDCVLSQCYKLVTSTLLKWYILWYNSLHVIVFLVLQMTISQTFLTPDEYVLDSLSQNINTVFSEFSLSVSFTCSGNLCLSDLPEKCYVSWPFKCLLYGWLHNLAERIHIPSPYYFSLERKKIASLSIEYFCIYCPCGKEVPSNSCCTDNTLYTIVNFM
jgi:hypothetical protein